MHIHKNPTSNIMDLLRCFGNIAVGNTVHYAWKRKMDPASVDYLFVDYSDFVSEAAQTVVRDIARAMSQDDTTSIYGWKSLKRKYTYLPDSYTWNNLDSVVTQYQTFFHKVFVDSVELLDFMIIQTSVDTFKGFLELLKPRNLMIAMDGVTPMADIMNKRHDNYLYEFQKQYTKKIIKENADTSLKYRAARNGVTWNFRKLNPGTKFMKYLFAGLKEKYPYANISNCDEPGEAWNKFQHQMKIWSESRLPEHVTYIYGDPDRILSSLLTNSIHQNFCFNYHNRGYECVDLSELGKNMHLYCEAHPMYGINTTSNYTDLINSMTYLQLIYRNNYLPRIEVLTTVEDSYFLTFVDRYMSFFRVSNEHLVRKKELNYKFLGRLLHDLEQIITINAEENKTYINYYPVLKEPNYTTWRTKALSKLSDIGTWTVNSDFTFLVKQTLDVGDRINYTCASNEKLMKVLAANPGYILPELQPRKYKASEVMRKYDDLLYYQKEMARFRRVLDPYHAIFSVDYEDDDTYHLRYFGSITKDVVGKEYLQGLLWIFNYYFYPNNKLSFWYYPHLKAPRMEWIRDFLISLKPCDFLELIVHTANDYEVMNTQLMTPVEELFFIIPHTAENLRLLPNKYRIYPNDTMFPNVMKWVEQTWTDKSNKFQSNLVQTRAATTDINDAFLLTLPPPDEASLRDFLRILP